jgi:hypothetical protein
MESASWDEGALPDRSRDVGVVWLFDAGWWRDQLRWAGPVLMDPQWRERQDRTRIGGD